MIRQEPIISAVVLAGGQSQRLGRDKAFLPVGGQPLVAYVVETLSALSDDVIVVANNLEVYEDLGLRARLTRDEERGKGSLMGIYSGLKLARHEYALAVACDMPFLNVDLLRYMVGLVPGYDVVVPRDGDLVEPLHAIYGKACLDPMAIQLQAAKRRIIAFFDAVRVRYVEAAEIAQFDPDRLSFVNINTPADWDHFQELKREA
ncbi:MAG TPA: molybdenum cofactor guanylyltransferase [Anaerolineae bacterium]|nr:molybdenum cofactor guanylyltransferase [Anaerolineae bacterium]